MNSSIFIVLLVMLHATPDTEPSVNVNGQVYHTLQHCLEDIPVVEDLLMESAPTEESYVEAFCVVVPVDA